MRSSLAEPPKDRWKWASYSGIAVSALATLAVSPPIWPVQAARICASRVSLRPSQYHSLA